MKFKFYSLILVVVFIFLSSAANGLERAVETSKNISGKIFSKISDPNSIENGLKPNIVLADESKDHDDMDKLDKKEKKQKKKKSKMKKKKTSKKAKKKKDSKHDDLM